MLVKWFIKKIKKQHKESDKEGLNDDVDKQWLIKGENLYNKYSKFFSKLWIL